jgi:hypothetical protein
MNALRCLIRPAAALLLAACVAPCPAGAQEAEAKRNTFLIVPIAYFTPETSLAGGIGGILAFRPRAARASSRPSSVMFSAVYTFKEQFTLQAKPEIYLDDEAWVVAGSLEWSRYPTSFFGLGNDAPEASGEIMTPIQVLAELQVMRRVVPAWKLYAGIMGVYESYRYLAFEPGGILDSGLLPGSGGGTLSGLGLTAKTDSRDSVFAPRRGRFWQASAVFHGGILGGGFRYAKLKADLRSYWPLSARAVLAFQGRIEAASGDAPFMALPRLGGDILMRGYLQGRYRDKVFAGLQAEARFPISGRFGAAVFAGLGRVAGGLSSLALDGFRPSVGAGLRIRITREGNALRLDYASGRGSTGFYVTVNEAF